MTSLENSSDKFLESIGLLRPFPAVSLFQTMPGNNSAYSTPMDSSVSTDELDFLDSSSMLSSFDHDMFLSALDPSSLNSLHGDELNPIIDQSEQWTSPVEPVFSTWNPSFEGSKFLHQKHGMNVSSCANKPQQEKMSPQDQKPPMLPSVHVKASPSPEKRRAPQIWTGGNKMRRSPSVNRHLKASDSSDNSDAMDDDAAMKHFTDGRNSASKNLVSERRRRKKLNERLYSLRALVPKISKMDKASIVSDAISYVEELQKQVEQIQADIHVLQSSKDGAPQGLCQDADIVITSKMQKIVCKSPIVEHRILELEVSQMEEQTYHLRIHCKKGPGVLVQLTRALEALDFEIVNANLTSVNEHILNTVVVKVRTGELLTSEDLKKLILDVVPKYGFMF